MNESFPSEILMIEKAGWPDRMEMIRQVREAAGLFAGAMPITPQQAWEEALDRVRGLQVKEEWYRKAWERGAR